MRVAAYLSYGIGITFILIGITWILNPAEKISADTQAYWEYLIENPSSVKLQVVQNIILLFGALFGSGLVVSYYLALSKRKNSFFAVTSLWAIIGFATTALVCATTMAHTGNFVNTLQEAPQDLKTWLMSNPEVPVDPFAILSFIPVGIWIITLNFNLGKSNILSNLLVYIGYAVGIAYAVFPVGLITGSEILMLITALAGTLILAPIWYIATGIKLSRLSPKIGI